MPQKECGFDLKNRRGTPVFAYIFVSSVLFINMDKYIDSINRKDIIIRFTEIMRCNLSYDFIIENNHVLFVNKIPFFMLFKYLKEI